MEKYTFFLEWDGGTYISQRLSVSLDAAISDWSEDIDMITIGAHEDSKSKFILDLKDETPVAVDEVTSVWCMCVSIEDKLAIIHIIK
ncbi:hypothetical protein WH95_06460 [Kiloniella litopenaei]|uniref:Uncharacterized protein n=1 Tax=Kiloniella litopenaei TaxID=1549748 RepID=A0A0M2R641_9PROT|nr:hypothetical protein [Kiloniella litopenaei]KKJ77352.1 hypothetical protein WH95_06460 [Kiloniella litopenaei]